MARQENDDLPVVREGRARRVLIAGSIGLLMLELGLRILLGNFAQQELVQPVEGDRCVELVPGTDVGYSGWLQRIPTTTLKVNAGGSRGPAFDARPRPGVLRIATVGDAFTMGLGVEAQQAFVQVAGQALQREGVVNEVLNFAVPGHGILQAKAQVVEAVVAARPDIVLLVVSPDDMTGEATSCSAPSGASPVAPLLRYLYSARVLWMLVHELGGTPSASGSANPEAVFHASIEELQRAATQNDFALALVLLSDRDAFTDPAYCSDCSAPHDLLGPLDVDVVDMSGVWRLLRAERDTSFLRGEGRLSLQGNQVVGLHLGRALIGWSELQRRAANRSARLRP
jgi:hypothetical protein